MMEGSDPAAILREIESLARASHVPVRLVTQRQIQQAQGSEAPQGVIVFAEQVASAQLRPRRTSPATVGRRPARGRGAETRRCRFSSWWTG